MILATEMTKHFEHLAKFVNICSGTSGDEVRENISVFNTLVLLNYLYNG